MPKDKSKDKPPHPPARTRSSVNRTHVRPTLPERLEANRLLIQQAHRVVDQLYTPSRPETPPQNECVEESNT